MSEVRVAAGRSYPASEASGGWEETPHFRSQGRLRPGAMTLRSHPEPKARGGSWEEPPTPEARASSLEDQPEEQWLSRHRRA